MTVHVKCIQKVHALYSVTHHCSWCKTLWHVSVASPVSVKLHLTYTTVSFVHTQLSHTSLCVCVCVCVCVPMFAWLCVWECVRACMCVSSCMFACVNVWACECVLVHECSMSVPVCIYMCVFVPLSDMRLEFTVSHVNLRQQLFQPSWAMVPSHLKTHSCIPLK